MNVSCVDLFCGIGGLTYGLKQAGVDVRAGVDLDRGCGWSFERNSGVRFIHRDVGEMRTAELESLFDAGGMRLLAGCAPCQPFSTYGRTRRKADDRWRLLNAFARAVEGVQPEFVTMENVPGLTKHEVFRSFLGKLERCGYDVAWKVLECERYGVPQRRRRLVLVASRIGPASLPRPSTEPPPTVADAIGGFASIDAGNSNSEDPIHVSAGLSPLNMLRIRCSRPGGTWRDWPAELVAECHRGAKGQTYPSVYGRMEWNAPAPTITTQCYGYGNGRFGHPVDDRAISLREAAALQSFPNWWEFVAPGEKVEFAPIGCAIGNAVPPNLGEAIGRVIVDLANGGRSDATVARS